MIKENGSRNSFASGSLVILLKSFSAKEIKELEKFVQSPFHNNRKEVTRFFSVVKNFHPLFDEKKFTREKIYKSLYPDTKYRDDVMRRNTSNLFKLCEEYASYKYYRKEQFEFDKTLLNFYLDRSLNTHYSRHQKKTEANINRQALRDAKHFLNISVLEELNRLQMVKSDSSGKRIDVQKQIDSVWKFAVITLLRLYKIAMEHSRQFNKNYSLKHMEQLLTLIEESGYMNSTAVEIWYLLIKFHISIPDIETFRKLKDKFTNNIKIFDPVESFIIYVSLLGYCYQMETDPGQNIRKEEFGLMSQMLNNGLMIQDGIFESEWFMYALITSLRADKISFAENLVAQYQSNIPLKERQNVIMQSKAELAFEKKEFQSALKYLALPKFNNVAEKLRVNQLYIKIYYELELSERFFYNADSFRHLIKNEISLSRDVKLLRENFIKFAVKLFKIKIGESNMPVKQLRKEIFGSKVTGAKWLIEKLEELE